MVLNTIQQYAGPGPSPGRGTHLNKNFNINIFVTYFIKCIFVYMKYTKEIMENDCINAKSIAQVCRNLGLKLKCVGEFCPLFLKIISIIRAYRT